MPRGKTHLDIPTRLAAIFTQGIRDNGFHLIIRLQASEVERCFSEDMNFDELFAAIRGCEPDSMDRIVVAAISPFAVEILSKFIRKQKSLGKFRFEQEWDFNKNATSVLRETKNRRFDLFDPPLWVQVYSGATCGR